MTTAHFHRSTLLVAAASLTLVLVLGAASGVRADEPAKPTSGIITLGTDPAREIADFLAKNKSYGNPLVIPGADFKNDGLGTDVCRVSAYSNAVFGTDTQPCEMAAPVNLPDGVTISSVWFFFLDDDDSCFSGSSTDIWGWMKRVDNYAVDSTDTMVTLTSSGTSPSVRAMYESDPLYPVVDYPTYNYYVGTRVCAFDHKVYAVVIFYG